MCPNKVKKGNLIDSLKFTGGYSQEIRRRFAGKISRYAKKLQAEFLILKKIDAIKITEFTPVNLE